MEIEEDENLVEPNGSFKPSHSFVESLENQPTNEAQINDCLLQVDQLMQEKLRKSLEQQNKLSKRTGTRRVGLTDGLQLPIGNFFYPCSGDDWETPTGIFSEMVEQFNYADPGYARKSARFVDVEIPYIGTIKKADELAAAALKPKYMNRKASNVTHHSADGFLTLIEKIHDLSIFFYRGDSASEGGSGVLWQGPVLIDILLTRIIDGGLFISDSSNGAGYLAKRMSHEEAFEHRHLTLRRIYPAAIIQKLKAYPDMKIWQITRTEK